MTWLDVFTVIQAISAISFVIAAAVAFKIYQMERKDSEEFGRRQARLELTQAYCQFNFEILSSRNNIGLMRELFYPQYNNHEVERIEFMFRVLNTLLLEWHFYKEHSHSEEAFIITLKSLMEPLARSVQNAPRNRFLVDDFEKIFIDYPEEFKEVVLKYIHGTN